MNIKVRRSLTLKSMNVFFLITMFLLAVFLSIQFNFLLEQQKKSYIEQLNNIANQIQKPLNDSLSKSDLNNTKNLLSILKIYAFINKVIVTIDDVDIIDLFFFSKKQIPDWAMYFIDIPSEITIPLYQNNIKDFQNKSKHCLILQIDHSCIYRFILNMIALMMTIYLLLTLIIVIVMTWCINRIIIRPLRQIAIELKIVKCTKNLYVSKFHQDDEIGLLVKNYNRNIGYNNKNTK
ncbi:HAMP domain-containing protein [Candidatus Providencia siddallii]|uniref:Probable cyclic di-GMP phosphodiesterase PdeK, partial n=1 Tax=Candidatus Providencia siddallii TaxID=1715285 RepID=A0ABP1CE62_9GAMM